MNQIEAIQNVIRKITGRNTLQLYDNSTHMDMWEEWYKGKVPSFQSYKIWNGLNWVHKTRFTLGMAKRVCEDWANLLVNEKTDITVGDEASQDVLWEVLRNCHFWRKANEGVEKTFAIGQGAWVVSVDDISVDKDGNILNSAKVNVSFVYGQKVYPITIEDDTVTECAFVRNDSEYSYISAHIRDENGIYKIHNIKAKSENGENYSWNEGDYYIFDTKNTIPWFACLKPNIANNIDPNSPLGISIFANAMDILKEIDLVYDSYQNEFTLGRKRVFINARSSKINTRTGEETESFDSNDTAIYVLPESDDGQMFMQDMTQTLRVNEHQAALQDQLNMLSYSCGFGTEHYKYNAGGVSTATQIISENSEMFRNIKKHEILIEDALVTIVRAIIYAVNTFTTQRITEGTNIEVKFDDSIIEDKKAEIERDSMFVSMGVMSKAEFRSKYFNEDLETAQKKIDELDVFTIKDDEETPYNENNDDVGGE